jgi:hypothetical protein
MGNNISVPVFDDDMFNFFMFIGLEKNAAALYSEICRKEGTL